MGALALSSLTSACSVTLRPRPRRAISSSCSLLAVSIASFCFNSSAFSSNFSQFSFLPHSFSFFVFSSTPFFFLFFFLPFSRFRRFLLFPLLAFVVFLQSQAAFLPPIRILSLSAKAFHFHSGSSQQTHKMYYLVTVLLTSQ